MNRPKSTLGMNFNPSAWFPDKGAEKTRPAVHQIVVQRPLDPEGEVPFTVFYFADERLHRVDGLAGRSTDVAEEMAYVLEMHWWKLDPEEGPRALEINWDGR